MNVSLNWIKEYVNLDGISVDEIVDQITKAGLEVDEVIDNAKQFENFVIAYVEEHEKHPDSDHLSVCKVTDGENKFNIVCGAPNVAAGQKIVLAKIGAVIPNGDFKIKKSKLRGVVSEGMICSERELNLSDSHEGIMVLDDSYTIGQSFAEAFDMNDVQLDIAMTPNRADALSHIGVARDIAALFDRELQVPKVELTETDELASDSAEVIIENETDCPRFSAKIIKDVTIKDSPQWLKDRLTSIGLRPINNIVDITNFVLHEMGQPMHAYDLDQLAGNKIIVKSANEVKKFTTLDSKERDLLPTDLLIWDAEKPVGIAGVMGGENSEVTESTKNILLESAYFRPSAVRKTSKKLSLTTDASYRFERGCDPNNSLNAANRGAQLMVELADGKLSKGEIDIYPKPIDNREVSIRYSRITRVLGFDIPNDVVKSIFPKLGLEIISEDNESLKISVPPFRPDIEREIDLIEEVLRIYGNDNVPPVEKISIALEEKIDQSSFTNQVRDALVGIGFNEIITNSLWNKETAEKFGTPVGVMNPITVEMTHLRPTLLSGILSTISKNIKVKESDLRLFELGRVFKKVNDTIKDFEDFTENGRALLAITGDAITKEWFQDVRSVDYYDLKGILLSFLASLGIKELQNRAVEKIENNIYEIGIQVKVKNQIIGTGGKISKDVLDYFSINQDVFVFDFDLDILNNISSSKRKYAPLLKYPKIVKDFAVVLNSDVISEDVAKTIRKASSKLLKNTKLFDIFESKSIGEGKKSLAFELEYFDVSRTLTEEEVEKDFWNAINKVKTEFNAELRG